MAWEAITAAHSGLDSFGLFCPQRFPRPLTGFRVRFCFLRRCPPARRSPAARAAGTVQVRTTTIRGSRESLGTGERSGRREPRGISLCFLAQKNKIRRHFVRAGKAKGGEQRAAPGDVVRQRGVLPLKLPNTRVCVRVVELRGVNKPAVEILNLQGGKNLATLAPRAAALRTQPRTRPRPTQPTPRRRAPAHGTTRRVAAGRTEGENSSSPQATRRGRAWLRRPGSFRAPPVPARRAQSAGYSGQPPQASATKRGRQLRRRTAARSRDRP